MIVPPRLLLDTHIWFWWVSQDCKLSAVLRDRIETGAESPAISSVSIYEVAILSQRGRIHLDLPFDDWLEAATVEAGVAVLAPSAEIAARAGALPMHHGDPLDRLIIASALHIDALLMSLDSQFQAYPELAGRLLR